MIWLGIAGFTGLIAVLLLWGAVRARRGTTAPVEGSTAVFKDQLAELARDRAEGRLSPAEAAAAELEVQRRLLAAADAAPLSLAPGGTPWALLVPVLLVIALGAPLLYLQIGAPTLPDRPAGARQNQNGLAGEQAQIQAQIQAHIADLRARLRREPGNVELWVELSERLSGIDAYGEAVAALDKAVALAPDRLELRSTLGEAQVMAAEGTVNAEAKKTFAAVLARDPKDPRARFYTGLGQAQEGELKAALASWVALVKDGPADAGWQPMVRARIADVATTLKIDLASLDLPAPAAEAPPPPRTPTLSPEDLAKVREMVAGLAARLKDQPEDVAGWMRLGRSYSVLGDATAAQEAYRQAAQHAPQDWQVLWSYARTLFEPGRGGEPPAEFVDLARRILALKPDHPESLWFVAHDAKTHGDMVKARDLLSQLLRQIPPETPLHAAVQQEIETLR